MKKYLSYNAGSTLILLVITIAITSVLGTSLLIVSMMNLKLKKDNTSIKQAEYLSEAGLNNAYAHAYDLVEFSIEDSLKKAQDYLEIHGSNDKGAEELFYNSYKLNIIGNIDVINNNSNPIVKIINPVQLFFIVDSLKFTLQSNYTIDDVSQLTYVDMIIKVPNYSDVLMNSVDILDLISFDKWFFSGEKYE